MTPRDAMQEERVRESGTGADAGKVGYRLWRASRFQAQISKAQSFRSRISLTRSLAAPICATVSL